ncbi:MAG: hypothetical protein F4X97_04505 [Boseongicola sp. SB0662_bin_57]|nr:hypothetical protein [Boseongicola sp. SB0662_bin_57]
MDEEFWKVRRCMLEPASEIFEAAVFLDAAADFHAAGLKGDARKALRAADIPAILDWCEQLLGGRGSLDAYRRSPVHRFRDVPGLPASKVLDGPVIPASVQRVVLDRDGCFCRFCGIPVIRPEARKIMRDAYPETVERGAGNLERHAAFQAMALDFGHIVPRSRGGRNTPDNLVVSCAPCKSGRGNWTLEEVGVADPRSTPASARPVPPALRKWDGLARILRERRPSGTNGSLDATGRQAADAAASSRSGRKPQHPADSAAPGAEEVKSRRDSGEGEDRRRRSLKGGRMQGLATLFKAVRRRNRGTGKTDPNSE